MPADLNKIDLVIQYALLVAGQEDSAFDRQLGPIHLIKYVYLADLYHSRVNGGATYTGVSWKFFKFGPWAEVVNERVEPALTAIRAERNTFDSVYGDEDWVRWESSDQRLLDQKEGELPPTVTMHLKRDIHRYLKDTPTLLDVVYKTAPMIKAAPGEVLDFAVAAASARAPADELGTRMEALSNKKVKKFGEKMAALRAAFHAQKQQVTLVSPVKPPRFDEVYQEGVKWLDGLAGEEFEEKSIVAEFSPDVWKSKSRNGDDIS